MAGGKRSHAKADRAWAGLRARLRFGQTPRRDRRRTGDENRSAAGWLPAKGAAGEHEKKEGSTQRAQSQRPIEIFRYLWDGVLVEMEGDFDLHAAIYRLAAGGNRRAPLPILYLRNGFFFQAETGPFENLRVDCAPIGGNRHVEQHGSLILGLASFVGVLRLRAR